ncbi:hypothetical protein NVP1084O_173 [Vibrio phage 1.084.O._10N.261.49.F5]|nr:hypothetical protein NVP1084O_173 [Vibrio phage 1.084.O._10N.261.49.F5]
MTVIDPRIYKTGNPVPSQDTRDYRDDVLIQDTLINDQSGNPVVDRTGTKELKSWSGMTKEFKEITAKMATDQKGVYAVGKVYEFYNETYSYNNILYGVKTSTNLPYTTTEANPENDNNLYQRGQVSEAALNEKTWYNWGTNSLGGTDSIARELYAFGEGSARAIVSDLVGGNEVGSEPDFSVFSLSSIHFLT